MSDDRPKKSWRDLDKQRDRSGGAARPKFEPGGQGRQQVEKSAAYSKYKAQLDKLFTPGGQPLPETLREKLGPASPEAQAQRALLDALRAAPNDENLERVLVAGAALPDDPRLLTNLLEVKNESLIPPVIEALSALIREGKKPNRMLLLQKLDALKNRAEDSDLIAMASALREEIE